MTQRLNAVLRMTAGLLLASVVIVPVAFGQQFARRTPSAGFSQTMPTFSVPPNPADAVGFTANFRWTASPAVGYQLVEITVLSTSTFAADRRLVFRLEPLDQGLAPALNGLNVDIPVSIDQGTKQKTITRSFPKWCIGNGYRLRVLESETELKNYTTEVGGLLSSLSSRSVTHAIYAAEYRSDWLSVWSGDSASKAPVPPHMPPQTPRADRAHIAKLPTDWRALQRFDAMIIDDSTLNELRNRHSEKFQASRDWILGGGTLVVLNSNSVESTTSSLDVKNATIAPENDIIGFLTQARIDAHNAQTKKLNELVAFLNRYEQMSRSERLDAADNDPQFGMMLSYIRPTGEVKAELREHLKQKPDDHLAQQFWHRPCAAGQIIGVNKTRALTKGDWLMIDDLIGALKSPMARRGVDPLLGDRRVNRWMIPGVAQPPVYTFMFLLTLFTILVGPIAYRKTTKSGRGYLMFAIAPVLALLTTAAMLIYGVVADGFSTQVRVRQVTWVDGTSGDATERIRATYFAGLTPRNGLRFPADAEVMIYPRHDEPSWENLVKQVGNSGSVTIKEDGQHFDSRLLPSRTQRQFVVHQPRHDIGRLTLHTAAENRGTPSIESSFDFELRDVVIRDQTGAYWRSVRIAPNESSAPCFPYSPAQVAKKLGNIFTLYQPLAAPGTEQNSRRSRRGMRDLLSTVSRQVGAGVISLDGTAEHWLNQRMQLEGELPTESFFALADPSDDSLWIDDATPVESIRFVFGTLP